MPVKALLVNNGKYKCGIPDIRDIMYLKSAKLQIFPGASGPLDPQPGLCPGPTGGPAALWTPANKDHTPSIY